jgi:hypothetical protein
MKKIDCEMLRAFAIVLVLTGILVVGGVVVLRDNSVSGREVWGTFEKAMLFLLAYVFGKREPVK